MFGDVALQRIDPQGADASRLVGPQVIAGDVERAPVGVEPVAGDELPQGDHVAAGQVEGPWAGLAGEPTPGRGGDPALVDAVAGQEALDRPGRSACRSGGRR